MLADIYTVTWRSHKTKCSYVHNSSLLFCMEKHLIYKNGKTHSRPHATRTEIHCAQQNNQTRHKSYGFKTGFGSREKKKERVETWNAFLLRFQNINLSNKPLDSFQKFPLGHLGWRVRAKNKPSYYTKLCILAYKR